MVDIAFHLMLIRVRGIHWDFHRWVAKIYYCVLEVSYFQIVSFRVKALRNVAVVEEEVAGDSRWSMNLSDQFYSRQHPEGIVLKMKTIEKIDVVYPELLLRKKWLFIPVIIWQCVRHARLLRRSWLICLLKILLFNYIETYRCHPVRIREANC